jgi:DMSO/TMAO reductase YedYZ molybdopterin-dependent catalytic subunit
MAQPKQLPIVVIQKHPCADGRRYVFDMSAKKDYGPNDSAHEDEAHTNRLDNFTAMEVTLKSRCHGHHLEGLAYPITPIGMHYLLIHYDIPQIDESTYQLRVGGLVRNPLTLDMRNIRNRPKVKMPVTMECGGNGRMGQRHRLWVHVPWNREAIGTAEWAGTPLRGILEEAGILPGALEVVFTGRDKGIQGNEVQYFQRALTVDHALAAEVFLAYEMNGLPLMPQHGFPLRLVVPGWLGMTNVKWLDSIEVVPKKCAGSQMKWYIFAINDNDPNRVPLSDMKVRSLMMPPGIPDFFTRFRYLEECEAVELRGRAWAGHRTIMTVEVSTNHGASWAPARLEPTIGQYAWVGWSFTWAKPVPGQYVLQVRATDSSGQEQSNDDSAHDYYAMDVNKPHSVDVVVVPVGTLKPGAMVEVPVQFPTM